MRVAIIGGTGFIGGYLVDELLEQGHLPVLLVRADSEPKVRRRGECELVFGDPASIGDLVRLLTNCDAVVYLIGILREHAQTGSTFEALQHAAVVRTLEAARACRVPRLLLMSANGVDYPETDYQATKLRAEKAAMASELQTTIFRPSVVFGDPRGLTEFATQLHDDMIAPVRPAIGFYNALGPHRGEFSMSPVHVEDVARAFVAALDEEAAYGCTYTLAGPETLTWKQLLVRIASAVGRAKWIMPVPLELMRLPATLLDRFSWFPVTRDQLTMLAAGNVGDSTELTALIGRPPQRFDAAHLAYLRSGV